MTASIGKVKSIALRDLFRHEAHDFTVWLSQNIDSLSERIDLPLVVEEREKTIGGFRADLVCRDTSGNLVIIENQLEQSDNKHLGQLVTYMGKLKANTAIWITPEPRSEHLETIAYLNRMTSSEYSFYLVKVEAICIDDSLPAPLFTLVSYLWEEQGENLQKSFTENSIKPLVFQSEPFPKHPKIDLPAVWCVFPRRDKESYTLFLENGYVGLGFAELGNLAKLEPSRDAFKKIWKRKYPKQTEGTVNQLYSMYYRFVHDVKVGDLVIYTPTWLERRVHIGEVISEYKHVPAQKQGYNDLRQIRWIADFSRDEFSEQALGGITINLAFFQVKNPKFLSELEAKLK